MNKICANCKRPFEAKRSTAKYCSARCRVQAHRKQKERERWFNWAYQAAANGIDTLLVLLKDDEYNTRAYRALKDLQAHLSNLA